ncbi:MAG: PAS domain S-box protein [Candidatus Latescibacteria bacterium]|nr:PAS domain S-box protein [Candidatus Latescibacterota bacterium]
MALNICWIRCLRAIMLSLDSMRMPLMEQLSTYIPSLVASLTEGIAVLDEQAGIQVFNPALVEMLGLPGAEAGPLEEFLGGGELGQLARQALAGELVWDQDIQYRKPAGQTCWLRVNTRRLTDRAGRPSWVLLTLKEISELKRAERDLWQVEKMSALGRLAASVAHEVRNPLSAIDIQLQLLQEELGGAGGEAATRVNRRLTIARTEMRRLEGIVQNFLRFSRPPALYLQPVQPNDLLRHLFSLVEPEAREHGIALVLDLEEPLPAISADENLLSQALLNVLINAFQAPGAAPRVILQSRLDRVKGQILLQVADNGRGIPPADLERVLEFYYTTKAEGTGLGLSIAQRIVHQHGGTLEVASQEGAGTLVSIRLWLEKGATPMPLSVGRQERD